jgi:hypothetical protein
MWGVGYLLCRESAAQWVPPEDGDRIQSPKRCVLSRNKQGGRWWPGTQSSETFNWPSLCAIFVCRKDCLPSLYSAPAPSRQSVSWPWQLHPNVKFVYCWVGILPQFLAASPQPPDPRAVCPLFNGLAGGWEGGPINQYARIRQKHVRRTCEILIFQSVVTFVLHSSLYIQWCSH